MIQYTPDFYFEHNYKLEVFNSETRHQELMFEKSNLLNIILREVKRYVPEVYHGSISTSNIVLDYNVKTFALEVKALEHSFYFIGEREVIGDFGQASSYNYFIHSSEKEVFDVYHTLMNKQVEQARKIEEQRQKKLLEEQQQLEEYKRSLKEQKKQESSKVYYLEDGKTVDYQRTDVHTLIREGLI